MAQRILPIFPLDLVLFPRQELPLRIFEPRYKQLVDDCMLNDGQFGICLIDKKNTVMGWQSPLQIGTIAKIRKIHDADISGTQLHIETIGHSRFKILRLIPPSIPLPNDYDPFSIKGIQKIAQLHEKSGTEKKLYIQAEVELLDEITDNISLKEWNKLTEMWKQKIIQQALPKIVNPFELDSLLLQYGLVSDIPNIEYVYSLASLGAADPYDLQPILEANTISELLKQVQMLLERR